MTGYELGALALIGLLLAVLVWASHGDNLERITRWMLHAGTSGPLAQCEQCGGYANEPQHELGACLNRGARGDHDDDDGGPRHAPAHRHRLPRRRRR